MARSNNFDDTSDHDWGVMIFAGYVFEWRLEYRAADGTGVSPDPADPDKTFRVLTLYVAEDLLAKTNPQAEPTPGEEQESRRYTCNRYASSLRPTSPGTTTPSARSAPTYPAFDESSRPSREDNFKSCWLARG